MQKDSALNPAQAIHTTIIEHLATQGVYSIIVSGWLTEAWNCTRETTLPVLSDGRMFDCVRHVIDENVPINYVGRNNVPIALLQMVALLRGRSPRLTTQDGLIERYGQIQNKARDWASEGLQDVPNANELIDKMANKVLEDPVKHIVSVTGTKYGTLLFIQKDSRTVVKGMCHTRHALVMKFMGLLETMVDENCAFIDKEGRFNRLLAEQSAGADHGRVAANHAINADDEFA